MIKIILPISLKPGKKKYFLSLNQYATWHYQLKNKLKKIYKIYVWKELNNIKKIKQMNEVEIIYNLYFPDKRKRDIDNYISVIGKFATDAIVEYDRTIIEDDNYTTVKKVSGYFCGFDSNKRGYVEMIIKEYKKD